MSEDVVSNELLYADDTLLLDTDKDIIQQYMESAADAGKNDGLSFNWTKLEVMSASGQCQISSPTGAHVKQVDGMVYLGSLLQSDGAWFGVAKEAGRGKDCTNQVGKCLEPCKHPPAEESGYLHVRSCEQADLQLACAVAQF